MATYPASDYPGAADTDIPVINAGTGDALNTSGKEHDALHNALRNSILAIQGVLGNQGAGIIIARKTYDPGSLASYTTTSTSDADVDATNLVVTFTVPASGAVLIRLEGHGGITATSNDGLTWSLRQSTTTVKAAAVTAGVATSSTAGPNFAIARTFYVSGLTPGASLTYKWGWSVSTGSATGRLYAGPGAAQAQMIVMIA